MRLFKRQMQGFIAYAICHIDATMESLPVRKILVTKQVSRRLRYVLFLASHRWERGPNASDRRRIS